MTAFDILDIAALVLVSFCVATASLISAIYFYKREDRIGPGFNPHEDEAAVFLFDHGLLVDATDKARTRLASSGNDGTPWFQLLHVLKDRFPAAEARLTRLPRGEKLDVWSSADGADNTRLEAEWRNGLLRVTLTEASMAEAMVTIDADNLHEMERDAALLRATTEDAPFLVWKTGPDGAVNWANQAYLALAEKTLDAGESLSWPPPRVFAGLKAVDEQSDPKHRRTSITLAGGEPVLWFDTEHHSLGAETLHFAVPADTAVRAEGALREFIQTLAKTFAHLPIGLAIFDRTRQLVLFNPALTDLSSLPVDFLSRKPRLNEFLDALRERRVMPEPKDYKSWRQRISALEVEAQSGTYQETWTLPNGLTYRVSGRPHPEGAIAFLFEDISSEVSLTRRFRTDLELSQSVLDVLPFAMAVFSHGGVLALSNTAYADLWGIDPRTTLGDISIADASRRWMTLCEPNPAWGDIRDFIAGAEDRAAWETMIRTTNGKTLTCRMTPLSGGGTMVAFEDPSAEGSVDILSHLPAASAL